MPPSKSRKRAGKALRTLPVQSAPFETGAGGIPDCIKMFFSVSPTDQSRFYSGDPRQFQYRPDLHRALSRAGNACGDGDGLVQVLGLNPEETTELFMRFGERAVRHEPFIV